MSEQQWRIVSAQRAESLNDITTFELVHEDYGRATAMVAYARHLPFVDHVEAAGKVARTDCLLWLERELKGVSNA